MYAMYSCDQRMLSAVCRMLPTATGGRARTARLAFERTTQRRLQPGGYEGTLWHWRVLSSLSFYQHTVRRRLRTARSLRDGSLLPVWKAGLSSLRILAHPASHTILSLEYREYVSTAPLGLPRRARRVFRR